MLKRIRSNRRIQLVLGLVMGIIFGFLLQKGGVTSYDVIIGQLVLSDFTVLKVMLTAIITGMIGVYLLRSLGLARLHPKVGSVGTSAAGGLLFGVGFATLGYCPGTVAGAVGEGSLDALFGGVTGILAGAGLFAAAYPTLQKSILSRGYFGPVTLPEVLKVRAWIVVLLMAVLLTAALLCMEAAGL